MDVIAENLGFTEGPLWAGDRLVVTSVSRGLIYAIDENGAVEAIAEPGGKPTGLASHADGSVWIAQGGAHADRPDVAPASPGIQVLSDGVVRDVLRVSVDSPNDCAFGPDGKLWFTDPIPPAFDDAAARGRLCRLDIGSGELEVLARDLRFPNGLVFERDRSALLVAETATSRILRFELSGDAVRSPSVWATLAGAHPDGLAMDAEGRVYVAAPKHDAILVVDSGAVSDRLALPVGSFPTNVCFGGADRTRLFVATAKRGRVFAVERRTPGATL